MMRRRPLLAILGALGFVSGQLAAPFPQFHSHPNEIGWMAVSVRVAGTVVDLPSAGRSAPAGACPACTTFGLSAIAPSPQNAVVVTQPAARLFGLPTAVECSRIPSPSRGRAPPAE